MDSKWPEALLVKFHIVWEGLQNPHTALKYLKQVIESTSSEDVVNEEAFGLYNQLEMIEKT